MYFFSSLDCQDKWCKGTLQNGLPSSFYHTVAESVVGMDNVVIYSVLMWIVASAHVKSRHCGMTVQYIHSSDSVTNLWCYCDRLGEMLWIGHHCHVARTFSVATAVLSLPRQHAWTNRPADEGMRQARATLQVCWCAEADAQGGGLQNFARGVHAVCKRLRWSRGGVLAFGLHPAEAVGFLGRKNS
jgi:hypothetical protein